MQAETEDGEAVIGLLETSSLRCDCAQSGLLRRTTSGMETTSSASSSTDSATWFMDGMDQARPNYAVGPRCMIAKTSFQEVEHGKT